MASRRATGDRKTNRRAKVSTTESRTVVDLFEQYWALFRGPALLKEYRFLPDRQFRFDFAHCQSRVAVELEGGLYQHGYHQSIERYHTDCVKYSLAALAGWCVVRLTIKSLEEDPGFWIPAVIKRIEGKTGDDG